MLINYYGHSCFAITSNDFIVCIDPYKDVEGRGTVSLKANAIYCSHEHFDHNYTDGVKLLEGLKNPFKVYEINSYHDDVKGAKRGKNIIRIFEAEGYRVAHFGDIGCDLSIEEIKLLSDLDVALIPVGGTYTIDALHAKSLIKELKPKVSIPMHYRNETGGFGNIGELKDFTKLFSEVNYVDNPYNLDDKLSGIVVIKI